MSYSARERVLQHIRYEGKLNLLTCAALAMSDLLLPRWLQRVAYASAVLAYQPMFTYPWALVLLFLIVYGLIKFGKGSLDTYQWVHLVVGTVLLLKSYVQDDQIFVGITKSCADRWRRRHRARFLWVSLHLVIFQALRQGQAGLVFLSFNAVFLLSMLPTSTYQGPYSSLLEAMEEAVAGSGLTILAWRPPPASYEPLEQDGNIRILHIPPRNIFSWVYDPLLGLEHVEVNLSRTSRAFTPISHRWKVAASDRIVNLNGYTTSIPSHMYRMVLSMRFLTSRMVWIDSFCINQDDNEEKSKQVQLMKAI